MKDENMVFDDTLHVRWLVCVVLVLAIILIVFTKGPPEAPEISLPSNPVILPLFAFVGAIIIYSWWCGGSDHKENVDAEHPDGRLTYPKFSIGKLGWWREKEETKHE